MKIKSLIMSGLMIAGCLTATAQPQEAKTVYDFNPHWYVQIQGGAQYTLGEIDFGDLISPNVQLSLGYQFHNVLGTRLSINAWQSKAGTRFDNLNREYQWDWKYVNPNLDLTVNLSNLFCGYNPNRVFNFSIFGGIGANIGFSNDDAWNLYNNYTIAKAIDDSYNWTKDEAPMAYAWDGTKVRLVGRFGAMADWRLSDKVSLGLEVNAHAVNDHYNSKKAGNADWYFNALAGLKINLGKTYTTRTILPPAPVEKIVERIVEKAPAPAPVVKETVEPLRRDVFFTINVSKISETEQQKVKEIADYLKKYPNARVEVVGYADAGTGNDKINDRLAAERADAVVKSLMNDYGISMSRIVSDSKGSRVQPFAENDLNRVSICIAQE